MKHAPISFLNCFIACVLGIIIAGAGIAMDGPSETQAATDGAANMKALQSAMQARPELLQAMHDTQPGTAQHHAAAAEFCQHAHGASAAIAQLPDGSLVCRRGKTLVAAKQGGAL